MADNPADTPQNTGDPLTDLAKRDVEQALSETEALAADAAEQVGGSTQAPDDDAQSPTAEPGESQSDEADQPQPETQPDGKAPEQDQEDQSGGNVDDKLNELESLLSQMHDKQDEGEAQDQADGQAGVDQQISSDRPADESGPDQPQPEKDAADQAAALDNQIATQADQQSDQQEGDRPEQLGETDQEQQPSEDTAPQQAEQSSRLVRLLGPVIYVLNLIDKPFKSVDPFIKQMVGVVAVATLVMAAMVFTYNLLFG